MAIEEDSAALLKSLDNQDLESQALDQWNGQTQLDAGWQSDPFSTKCVPGPALISY